MTAQSAHTHYFFLHLLSNRGLFQSALCFFFLPLLFSLIFFAVLAPLISLTDSSYTHLHTLLPTEIEKKIQKQEVCSTLLTPSLAHRLFCLLVLKKSSIEGGNGRMNWVPESAGPLHVSPSASGFQCGYLSLLISGQ